MAESEEAEVDYYAVLNVSKEVKVLFQREKKEKHLISHTKCISFHFSQTMMSLKLLPDACAHHINLQTSRPAKKKVRLKKLKPCSH